MIKQYDETDIYSILDFSKKLEKTTLRKYLGENEYFYNQKHKGALGNIVESEFFGYAINSKKEADFKEAKMELKVVPIKKIKKKPSSELLIKQLGLSAKERIVLSIIQYDEIINETWTTTELHHKLDKILMMFYQHEKKLSPYDLLFILSSIWEPLQEDLPYLQKDWELIQSKIVAGKAHELSEGDTLLLGACTKGVTSNSTRKQPNSDVPAMQRAFSLKRSYVDHIFNRLYADDLETKNIIPLDIYSKIIVEFNKIKYQPLQNLFSKYSISVNRQAKQFLYLVTSALFEQLMEITSNEFNENNIAEIEIKTILLKSNNIPKESMSFEQIKFDEIIEEDWLDSEFRSKFENKKLLWFIYKTNKPYKNQRELDLSDIFFIDLFYWNMPISDLDSSVRELWVDTAEKIKNQNFYNFKKLSETEVAHVRPKATNSKDLSWLKSGINAPKRSFWLNNKYVARQIKDYMSNNQNKMY